MPDGDRDIAVDALGMGDCNAPADHRAPIVRDEPRLGDAERVEQRFDIGNERLDPAACDAAVRDLRPPVAPEIGGDDPEARRDQRRDLVAPQVARVGKPVQQDVRTRADDLDLHLDVVDGQHATGRRRSRGVARNAFEGDSHGRASSGVSRAAADDEPRERHQDEPGDDNRHDGRDERHRLAAQ